MMTIHELRLFIAEHEIIGKRRAELEQLRVGYNRISFIKVICL